MTTFLIDSSKRDQKLFSVNNDWIINFSQNYQHIHKIKLLGGFLCNSQYIINSNNKIEKFLYEKCERSPFYETVHTDLYNHFEKFNENPWSSVEKELLDNYFDVTFLRCKIGTVVNSKDNRIYGWRGITLKECIKDFNYKILPNKVNSKKVKQINIQNELIATFNSQREAAVYLKITAGALNASMKKGKLVRDVNTNTDYYFNYDV